MISRLSARVIAIIVGVALLMLVGAWALNQWQQKRAAQARERVSTNQAVAGQHTAGVGVNVVAATTGQMSQSERQSQEGQDAINHAQGGDSNDAADRATCELRSYRGSERCRKLRAVHP